MCSALLVFPSPISACLLNNQFPFSPSLLPFPTCLLVAPTRQKITNGSTEGKGFEAFWVPHKAMPAIFRSGSTATSGAARPYLRRRCGRIGRACFRCPPLTCRCEPRPRPDLIASCVVHGIHDPFSCHKRVDANFEDVRSRRRLRPRFCCARVEKKPPLPCMPISREEGDEKSVVCSN